jgi:hypothetical protein
MSSASIRKGRAVLHRELSDEDRWRVLVNLAEFEGVTLDEASFVLWNFEMLDTSAGRTLH